MKHKIKETVPEHQKEIISHTTCDICKRSDRRSHGKDTCDIHETEIMFRDVEMNYPECGNGTTYSYDICHECFVEKVMPALSDLGAEPTIAEWDY
jgi:hypothetical protein